MFVRDGTVVSIGKLEEPFTKSEEKQLDEFIQGIDDMLALWGVAWRVFHTIDIHWPF